MRTKLNFTILVALILIAQSFQIGEGLKAQQNVPFQGGCGVDTSIYLPSGVVTAQDGWMLPTIANGSNAINALIVFAEFSDKPLSPTIDWPANSLPSYSTWLFEPPTGPIAPPPSGIQSFTQYVKDMSLQNMELNGTVYPNLIQVQAGNYIEFIWAVRDVYDQVDFSLVGGIQNFDKWDIDWTSGYRPKSPIPNGKPDLMYIIFRNGNETGWEGSEGGLAQNISFSTDFESFVVVAKGEENNGNGLVAPYNIISHETAHLWLGSNSYHLMGATNSTNLQGNKMAIYGQNGGWGIMSGGFLQTVNAWERERLGWNPSGAQVHYLEKGSPGANGSTFVIRDFVSTGDAIKLKLPNIPTNEPQQYIWIENHQKIHSMDRPILLDPCDSDGTVSGVYMFKQIGMDTQGQYTPLFEDFLIPISGDGNWDYQFTSQRAPVCFFGNTLEDVMIKAQQNPLSGNNDFRYRFFNVPDDLGQINGSIMGNNFQNATGKNNKCYNSALHDTRGCNQGGNGGNIDIVASWLESQNGQVIDPRDAGEAFQVGDKLGIGTNPSTASENFRYKDNQGVPIVGNENTIYLNNLAIEILAQDPVTGDMTIHVEYSAPEVNNDQRWCGGEILLSDHAFIKGGHTLEVTQSQTPNCNYPFVTSGQNYEFSPKTTLRCASNSSIQVLNNGSLEVKDGSSLVLEAGAILSINSNSIADFTDGSHLVCKDQSKIIVQNNGKLRLDNSSDLFLGKDVLIILDGPNALLEINGPLELGDDAHFTFTDNSMSTQNSGYVIMGLPYNPSGQPNITMGNNASIHFEGSGPTDLIMKIKNWTYLYPEQNNGGEFALINGKVEMGELSKINTGSTPFTLNHLQLVASDPSKMHNGIQVNGQSTHLFEDVEISNANTGVEAFLFWSNGSPLRMKNVTISNCIIGLKAYDKGINLQNVSINNCQTSGFMHIGSVFTSVINGSHFQNNGHGSHCTSGGGNYLVIGSDFNSNTGEGMTFTGRASFISTCSDYSTNGTVGLRSGLGASLFLDDSKQNTGAQNDFSNNPVGISLSYASNIFMSGGKNRLVTNPLDNRSSLKGILSSSITSLDAKNNEWNTRSTPCGKVPTTAADYELANISSQAIVISDPDPKCLPSTCELNPGGTGGYSQLSICETCRDVVTTSYETTPLNNAILDAIGYIEDPTNSNSSGNNLTALSKFAEIFGSSLPNLTTEESLVLDYAYAQSGLAFSQAIAQGAISCDPQDHMPVLEIGANLRKQIIDDRKQMLYGTIDTVFSNLDEAQFFHSIGCLDVAKSKYIEVEAQIPLEWQIDSHVKQLQCLISTELNLVNGDINFEEFVETFEACKGNSATEKNYPIQINDTDSSLLSIPHMDFNIIPNPNNGIFSLNIGQKENHGTVGITLVDLIGKTVLSEEVKFQGNEYLIDFSGTPAGIYLLTVITTEGKIGSKRISIIQ